MAEKTTDEHANECITRLLGHIEREPFPQNETEWLQLHEVLSACLAAVSRHVRSEQIRTAVDGDTDRDDDGRI